MAKQQIGLLFGVQGGGKLSGESGQLILQQLNKIARSIDNTNNRMKVVIGVNENQTRQLIQRQLNNISKGLKITIGGDFSNNGGQNATKNVKTTKFSEFVDGDVSKRAMSQATALKTKEELRKKQEQTHKAQLQREEQEKKNAYNEAKRAEEAAERAKKKAEAEKKQAQITEKQIQAYSSQLAGMGGKADERTYANTGIKAVTDAYEKYLRIVKEAQVAEKAIDSNNPQTQQAFIDKVNEAKIAQQQLNAVLHNSTAFEKQETVYQKVIARITEYQAKFKETLKNTPQLAAQLEELRQKLDSNTFVGTENKANQMFVSLTNQIRQAGGEAETLGQKIRRIFGEKLGYGIIASAAMMARQAVRQVYTNVVELDKAVVDLQIATGKNREETKELVDTYSDLGRELGATTKEVANAADTWLRQGYNIEDTNELIKQSTMLSKLGQMESAEASTALTSSLKGYQLAASDAASVVDKLTAVDMEAAASAGDIATAMAECANSARIAGVDMNTLIGYLTTVKEVTQDGSESVGTFAKTMFARMGNIKAGNLEDPETGENLSDVESALSSVGIKLRSANNQFRDFDDVLSEVAAGWDNYSNVQQHAIAVAFAGTRQQEKFLVLMENYGDAMEYAGVSTESAGTALDKYTNSYLPSVQAAQDSFTASFEQFSQAFLDSDLIAGVIGLGDGFMQFLTSVTKFLSFGDGLVGQLALITAGLWALNAAMVAFNEQTGIFASTGEPIEALTYHAREYSGGDTERVNKIIVLFTREYLEKPTSLGLIA